MHREYYEKCHAVETKLGKDYPSGDAYLVGLKPGGTNTPCNATLSTAARCIVEGTHRLATQAEVDAFLASQELLRTQAGPVGLAAAEKLHAALRASRGEK